MFHLDCQGHYKGSGVHFGYQMRERPVEKLVNVMGNYCLVPLLEIPFVKQIGRLS